MRKITKQERKWINEMSRQAQRQINTPTKTSMKIKFSHAFFTESLESLELAILTSPDEKINASEHEVYVKLVELAVMYGQINDGERERVKYVFEHIERKK